MNTNTEKTDRLRQADEKQFTENSLVGSYFYGEGMRGCVVSEIHPAIYLLEILDPLTGESALQKIYKLEDMLRWEFYDSHEWLCNATGDK